MSNDAERPEPSGATLPEERGGSFARRLCLMTQVPRFPSKTGTAELLRVLKAKGFTTSQRTIQRDLVLCHALLDDLENDGNTDQTGWFWRQEAKAVLAPAPDAGMVVALRLLEGLLRDQNGSVLLEALNPYLQSADVSSSVLGRSREVPDEGEWQEQIRVLTRSMSLLPAPIPAGIYRPLCRALIDSRQLRCRYRPWSGLDEGSLDLHPLALILRDQVLYLVATAWDSPFPRHYALHRMHQCEVMDIDARHPPGFDLDDYLASGLFEYVQNDGLPICLEARFSRSVAAILEETALSEDQAIEAAGQGWVKVTATVRDSKQLRMWLLGFGNQVAVLGPESLRKEIQVILAEALEGYG